MQIILPELQNFGFVCITILRNVFYLYILSSYWHLFLLIWRPSCRRGLVEIYYLRFDFSGNVITFPSFTKVCFSGNNFLNWQFYFLTNLKTHTTLAWSVRFLLRSLFSGKLEDSSYVFLFSCLETVLFLSPWLLYIWGSCDWAKSEWQLLTFL